MRQYSVFLLCIILVLVSVKTHAQCTSQLKNNGPITIASVSIDGNTYETNSNFYRHEKSDMISVFSGSRTNIPVTLNPHSEPSAIGKPLHWQIWIDINNDGQFKNDEIVYTNTTLNSNEPININFDPKNIPLNNIYTFRVLMTDELDVFNDPCKSLHESDLPFSMKIIDFHLKRLDDSGGRVSTTNTNSGNSDDTEDKKEPCNVCVSLNNNVIPFYAVNDFGFPVTDFNITQAFLYDQDINNPIIHLIPLGTPGTLASSSIQQMYFSYNPKKIDPSCLQVYTEGVYRVCGRSFDFHSTWNIKFKNLCLDAIGNSPGNVTEFSNLSSAPNPFTQQTELRYELQQNEPVSIELYDILGNKVKTLFQGQQYAGQHRLMINAQDLAAGTYLCIVKTSSTQQTHRILKMK